MNNAETGKIDQVTILQSATQTARFEKPSVYEKYLLGPGTKWAYSHGGMTWPNSPLIGKFLESRRFPRRQR